MGDFLLLLLLLLLFWGADLKDGDWAEMIDGG